MVPNGWARKPIKELCESIIDCVNKTAKHVDYVTPFKMIRTSNVRNGRVDTENVRFVEEEIYKQWIRRGAPKDGDIIFTREAPVGEAGILESSKGIFLGQRTMMYRSSPEISDNRFLFYSLMSRYCQKQIEDFSNGGTVAHMRVPDCGELIINTPPLPEQRKIAKIISIWDKAISTTERLIDNNKQQKKALMQQLLTGKKRFAGFTKNWKQIHLGDMGKCITGLTYKPSDTTDDGMLVLRSSNIQNSKLTFKDNVFVNADLKVKSKTQENDILVCVRNGSKNLIGKSTLIKGRAVGQAHGAFMTIFRGKYPLYVSQLFQSGEFFRQVNMNLGATINSINTSDLHKFKFSIPTDENEINAIAACLSNAEKETELLQQQLADFKKEKKALMQQLLTGKRRVKFN